MARAILIDPVERSVSETAVSERWEEIRRRFETNKLIRVATLPKGDALYLIEKAEEAVAKFRLGGSERFAGRAVVLGKRGEFGLICDAVIDADDVEALTQFDPA